MFACSSAQAVQPGCVKSLYNGACLASHERYSHYLPACQSHGVRSGKLQEIDESSSISKHRYGNPPYDIATARSNTPAQDRDPQLNPKSSAQESPCAGLARIQAHVPPANRGRSAEWLTHELAGEDGQHSNSLATDLEDEDFSVAGVEDCISSERQSCVELSRIEFQ